MAETPHSRKDAFFIVALTFLLALVLVQGAVIVVLLRPSPEEELAQLLARQEQRILATIQGEETPVTPRPAEWNMGYEYMAAPSLATATPLPTQTPIDEGASEQEEYLQLLQDQLGVLREELLDSAARQPAQSNQPSAIDPEAARRLQSLEAMMRQMAAQRPGSAQGSEAEKRILLSVERMVQEIKINLDNLRRELRRPAPVVRQQGSGITESVETERRIPMGRAVPVEPTAAPPTKPPATPANAAPTEPPKQRRKERPSPTPPLTATPPPTATIEPTPTPKPAGEVPQAGGRLRIKKD